MGWGVEVMQGLKEGMRRAAVLGCGVIGVGLGRILGCCGSRVQGQERFGAVRRGMGLCLGWGWAGGRDWGRWVHWDQGYWGCAGV